MEVALEVLPPYDAGAALAALAAHAVPGLETTDLAAGTHTRLFATSSGPVVGTVRLGPGAPSLVLESVDPATNAEITTAVRRWLDLDTDPETVRGVLGQDPLVGPLLAARPGLRIPGYLDGFEGAACTVLGQQVSLAAARTFAGRLVSAFGSPGPAGLYLFPTPSTLAGAGAERIQQAVGLTGARSRTIHALAVACADGLAIDPEGDHAGIRRRLLALPGIGPWTVDYLAMRALRDRNAYPEGDLVLKRALGASSVQEVRAHGEAWRPLRAYAVFQLWTAAAYIA
ncbi:DNA-3-methyladenine glycosylase family protein [Arthrobacter crystallopoietes]|uniref:DNA-3-methyladenine glycosylase II n=1 Tax=Crystallibacter crystallopoietes TaxID=37928 RepID=A0A1H1EBA9_9MICC|nr:AlkA N-terminal domain-containing protein [Arthrobacter crystallopoietes]AUI49976.1 3-methyladenine DNA glycosylase 2 [Arthrobacter crystallopoietes]SDQ85830.1 DNA-3-methyladenine glycosylase II [Arthrobacter crystallopoietes]